MKRPLAIASLLLTQYAAADHSSRSQFADVTHIESVYEEIAFEEPREHCWDETVSYERQNETTTPLLGALLGGVIGHQVGHGSSNKKVGAFVGAGLGAAIGSQAARGERRYHVEHHCETVYDKQWKRELVGYDVTYRYHGVEYQARMPHDPGKQLRVHVSVTPAS